MSDEKYNVILIGGSPMSGKSTLASSLASLLSFPCIPTDDLGTMAQAMVTKETHPEFFYKSDDESFETYYSQTEPEVLFDDIYNFHMKLWPGVHNVIKAHANWSGPAIVEGYSLYPEQVNGLKEDKLKAFWLICEPEVFAKRFEARNENSFFNNKKMRENFILRSQLHNNFISEQAIKYNMKTIEVRISDDSSSIYEKAKLLLNL